MKKILALVSCCVLCSLSWAENITIDGYRQNLLSSPSGARIGELYQGARLEQLEKKGDWVKVSIEGWMWKDSITSRTERMPNRATHSGGISSTKILIPSLLKKGYAKEDLQEMIWFDIAFDTAALPGKTRAVKGALVISDLFDEEIMRIHWTINKPLAPGEEYVEKGTNFAYNDFLSHHQWVRFTKREDMKVSFEVRHIIFDNGKRQSYYR